jgi:hypothetical protein
MVETTESILEHNRLYEAQTHYFHVSVPRYEIKMLDRWQDGKASFYNYDRQCWCYSYRSLKDLYCNVFSRGEITLEDARNLFPYAFEMSDEEFAKNYSSYSPEEIKTIKRIKTNIICENINSLPPIISKIEPELLPTPVSFWGKILSCF